MTNRTGLSLMFFSVPRKLFGAHCTARLGAFVGESHRVAVQCLGKSFVRLNRRRDGVVISETVRIVGAAAVFLLTRLFDLHHHAAIGADGFLVALLKWMLAIPKLHSAFWNFPDGRGHLMRIRGQLQTASA